MQCIYSFKSVLMLLLLVAGLTLTHPVYSQVVSGNLLKWTFAEFTKNEYELSYYSNFMRAGYQEVSLKITNKSSDRMYIEAVAYVTDFCGNTKSYTYKTTVSPNSSSGGRPFWDGASFETPCEEKKSYENLGYSRIKSVRLDVQKIVFGNANSGNSGSGTGGSGTNEGNNSGGQGETVSSGNNTGGSNNIAESCPPQSITMINSPSVNCVQLLWLNQSTIQFNEKSNQINTQSLSTSFVLSYKKTSDLIWKKENVQGYQMGYNLKMLDPCTKYEVKLQRKCSNGTYSDFSNTITFTTTCPKPGSVKAEQITSTSAKINSMYSPGVNVCSSNPKSLTLQIEYTSAGNNWQTVYATVGTGGSVLTNLQPNTSYRVRLRYAFGSGIYSQYSNEINFKTKP